MKKTFPLIIVLITLSLLGIIYIQVNWLTTQVEIKKEQLKERITLILAEVGQDLVDGSASSSFNRTLPKPSFKLPSELYDINRQFSVINRYSDYEIKEKIQKAFIARGLKDTKFEFAIQSTTLFGKYEMMTENFLKLAEDTVHNLIFSYFMMPSGGSNFENLTPDEQLWVAVPDADSFVYQSLGWLIIGAIIFTLIIITAFFLTVRTILRQKKLSEIKGDFINNMTHEFKTPLATISLAVDALRNEKVQQDKNKLDYFTGIIKDENKRMNKQVETILQAAQLDKQKIQLNLKELKLHEIISKAYENLRLQVQEKNGHVILKLNAANDLIQGDEVHLVNLIGNLMDNAIKYSNENLQIIITTKNSGKFIRIQIEDNGIGMNKETLKKIFEKFYRAHTGNLHNVKGFGLGLSYVKTMVEAHQGTIKAESAIGVGSTFTINLPLLLKK